MKDSKNIIWFIIIFAFCLRLPGLNDVFISSDEANFILASLDFFHIFDSFNLHNILLHLLRFFAFPWGYVTIALSFLNIAILSLLRITITEVTLRLPIAILGSLSCFLIYLVAKEIYSRKTGLFAALFLAVLPVHIECSKMLTSSIMISSSLLLCTVFFFLKYFNQPSQSRAFAASLSLGFYLASDNQFLLIFFVIFMIGIFYSPGTLKERLKQTISRLWRWQVIGIPLLLFLPLLISWVYFALNGKYSSGFLGHLLGKEKTLGLHLEIFSYLLRNCGLILTVLFLPALFYSFFKFIKLKKDGFLFLWPLFYLSIWLFLVKPYAFNRTYYISAIIPLLIITAYFLTEFIFKKLIFVLISLIVIATLFTTFSQATLFDETFASYIDLSAKFRNYGIKTAGFYFRENIEEGKNIFSDLGIPVNKYYLHKKVLSDVAKFWSISSSQDTEKYAYLNMIREKVDLALIRHKNKDLAEKTLGSRFYRIIDIYNNGQPVMHIYSRDEKVRSMMETSKYDRLFDLKYGNFKSLYVQEYFKPLEL